MRNSGFIGALALGLMACASGGDSPAAKAPEAAVAAKPVAPTVRSAPTATPQSGSTAPSVALVSVEDGKVWSLQEGLDPEGTSSPKGYVLAFMASWCTYCTRSLPTLVQLEKDNPDLEIVTVSIDVGPEAQQEELLKVRKFGLQGPVVAADKATIDAWIGGGRAVPKYYFIDHNGTIVARDDGFGDKVEPLMAKQAARALRD